MSNEALTWAYRQTTGNAGRKAVLVALADKADEKHSCWPSQALLATMTEQSDRTVRGHLAELEAGGFIRRDVRRDKAGHRSSDRYTLAVSVVVAVTNRQNQPAAKPAGRAAPGPVVTGEIQAAESAGRKSKRQKTTEPTGKTRQVTQREPSTSPTVMAAPKRGARLPENWIRSDTDRAWQQEHEIPDEFARVVTGEFKAYWAAASGRNAAKLDWSQAWRNWVSREWRRDGARWRREHGMTGAPMSAAAETRIAADTAWMRSGQATG